MSPTTASTTHPVHSDRGTKVIHAITLCAPASEVYAALHDQFTLAQVVPAPGRFNWLSSDDFEFWSGDSNLTRGQIINRKPDELIAWQTEASGKFPHAGTIRLATAPADEGVEVIVQIEYEATLADKFAKLFGKDPGNHAKKILRRLKALIEAGEIPTIEGQSAGEPQRKNQS